VTERIDPRGHVDVGSRKLALGARLARTDAGAY